MMRGVACAIGELKYYKAFFNESEEMMPSVISHGIFCSLRTHSSNPVPHGSSMIVNLPIHVQCIAVLYAGKCIRNTERHVTKAMYLETAMRFLSTPCEMPNAKVLPLTTRS